MRRFTSYGPPDPTENFVVERKELVERCVKNLVGNLQKGGYFFTIWAPRQTGKTWLIRQVVKEIKNNFPNTFDIISISLENILTSDLVKGLNFIIKDSSIESNRTIPQIEDPEEFIYIFLKRNVFDKRVILLIDEVDSIDNRILEVMVQGFRKIYLNREKYLLHGLALVGVRAVLGVESDRGSPFNIQRSLKVENFSFDEVKELFGQYQKESGQKVEPEVIELVYEKTSGQPGLVGWFGELLTEKYNPGRDKVIDRETWERVYTKALYVEPNNTVLNIIKKAFKYKDYVLEIYRRDDVKFSFSKEWCNYLYMHGVIREVEGEEYPLCRISNEFIQARLFDALCEEEVKGRLPVPYLEPLDNLEDVLKWDRLRVKPLIERYKRYLERTKSKEIYRGIEARRQNGRVYEVIFHFHLYSWIFEVLKDWGVSVIPEFPTGNGRVDIALKDKRGNISIIEVKSFRNIKKLEEGKKRLEAYARKVRAKEVLMALFVDFDEERYLKALTEEYEKDNIKFYIEPIVIK